MVKETLYHINFYFIFMQITKQTIKNLITNYENEEQGIARLVLQDMFDKSNCSNQTDEEFADSLKTSFSDLLHYGSNNGSIARLIYYKDTNAFFDTHYDEIEELRNEYEDSAGESIIIKGDLKDFMARFGYETIARKLADTLFPDTF
jgi:hypothetical protein